MDSLPDEVLTRILLYLPTRDLLWSAPLVCRRWWQLVMCDCQRQVSLARHTPAASVTMALSARPGLRVLRCTGLLHAYTALPEALPLCPLLRCLEMGFATVPSAAVDAHKIAAALSPGLRHLNVEGIRNIEIGFISILVRRCPQLEALNLSHCAALCDESVRLVASHLPHLRRLNLTGIEALTDASLDHILQSEACRCGSLSALWIDGYGATAAGLTDFFSRLSLHSAHSLADVGSSLSVLWISFGDQLTDAAVRHIASLSQLLSLTLLKAPFVSAAMWCQLFSPSVANEAGGSVPPSAVFPRLEHLDLSEGNTVNDEVIRCITSNCGSNLRSLMLNWCYDISDNGLSAIMQNCHKLFHLSLVGNYSIIGDSLLSVYINLPHLRYLNLNQCFNVPDSVFESLALCNHDLCIFDRFGELVGGSGVDDICHYDLWRTMSKMPICEH